jgi:SpoVK/Ycf46/Vps4 family AAA+-type ATPase
MKVVLKDIVRPRREVLEGRFQGVIQSHKVDSKEPRLENNPEEFFKITYPSSALKRALERINEKLGGVSHQGGILLVGPYGSGKTHVLISLFHTFEHPEISKKWLREWGIDINLSASAKSVIISTRRYDVDLLWEPIFTLLGRKDVLSKIRRFPTVDQIEEVIGDSVCAIFIDEIENWYGSFNPETQADLIERNETFLEHLLEVANDPNKKLFVFITFLEEKEGLKKIFNRTKPVRIDVSAIGDREKIVLHRLLEDADKKDLDKVETIVKEYVDGYVEPIKIENPYQYKQRMVRAYPFHPFLLDTLTQIYEAATERQDIRGMMNVLADAVRDTYDKRDLILLSDIDENAFRGIDLRLVEKYSYDLERVKDLSFGREILKTVLIATLNEKTVGATESDILLSVFSPTLGHTLNALIMDLENIYGKPYYLHKEKGVYVFKHELNIFALLEKEKKKITDDEIKRKIADIVKKDVFDNRVFVYGFEEIPTGSKFKILVTLESWGTNEQLKDKLNKFYKGKEWQNTYIIVLPTVESLFSFEIMEKTKRLIAAEKLRGQVEDGEGKLQRIISDERKEIAEKIERFYGYMVKWVVREDKLVPRLINVSADVNAIRDKAGSDASLVGDYILDEIKDVASGKRIEFVINDFKKFRKYPLILDDEVVYTAIRNLHRDKRVVIQGERGRWYIDDVPRDLEPRFVLFDPKYAPTEVIEVPEHGIPEGEIVGPKEVIEEVPTVERREKKLLDLRGNSPRVILSQVEARTRESDIFKSIEVTYQFRRDLTKQEIMKFIKQLPHEEADIEGEVELWRETGED